MIDSDDIELKYNRESKKWVSWNCIWILIIYVQYSEINYVLTANSTRDKKVQEEIILYRESGR